MNIELLQEIDTRRNYLIDALHYRGLEFAAAQLLLAQRALANFPNENENLDLVFPENSYAVYRRFAGRVLLARSSGWSEHDSLVIAFLGSIADCYGTRANVAGVFAMLVNKRSEMEQLASFEQFLYLAHPSNREIFVQFIEKIHGVSCIQLLGDQISESIDSLAAQWQDKSSKEKLLAFGNRLHTLKNEIMDDSEKGSGYRQLPTLIPPTLDKIEKAIHRALLKSAHGMQMLIEMDFRSKSISFADVSAGIKNMESAERKSVLSDALENRQARIVAALLADNPDDFEGRHLHYAWDIVISQVGEEVSGIIENTASHLPSREILFETLGRMLEKTNSFQAIATLSDWLKILIRRPETETENHLPLLETLMRKSQEGKYAILEIMPLYLALANLARRQARVIDVTPAVEEVMNRIVFSNLDSKESKSAVSILGPLSLPLLQETLDGELSQCNYSMPLATVERQHRLLYLMQTAGADAQEIANYLRKLEH